MTNHEPLLLPLPTTLAVKSTAVLLLRMEIRLPFFSSALPLPNTILVSLRNCRESLICEKRLLSDHMIKTLNHNVREILVIVNLSRNH
ncbi:unnamed protein product, partial [Hymenolepis diminuta]